MTPGGHDGQVVGRSSPAKRSDVGNDPAQQSGERKLGVGAKRSEQAIFAEGDTTRVLGLDRAVGNGQEDVAPVEKRFSGLTVPRRKQTECPGGGESRSMSPLRRSTRGAGWPAFTQRRVRERSSYSARNRVA